MFGKEIRRLRQAAGLTMRDLSGRLDISPSHLSDIEHGHRRPSEQLLARLAAEFSHLGVQETELQLIVTGLDEETRRWATVTPGARAMLRRIMETGRTAPEIIQALDEAFPEPMRPTRRKRGPVGRNRR